MAWNAATVAGLADQLNATAAWLEGIATQFSTARDRFSRLVVDGVWSGAGRGGYDAVRSAAADAASRDAATATAAAAKLRASAAEANELARAMSRSEAAVAAAAADPGAAAIAADTGVSLAVRAETIESRAASALAGIRWYGNSLVTNGHSNRAVLATFASASPHNPAAKRRLLELVRAGSGQLALGDPVGLALLLATMTPKERRTVLKGMGTHAAAAEARGTLELFDSIVAAHPDVDLTVVAAALAANRPAAQAFVTAASFDGLKEGPSNSQPFAEMVGHAPNQAWCTSFVNAVSSMAGTPIPIVANDAYTETQRRAWIDNGAWYEADPAKPAAVAQPGDYVYFWGAARGQGRTVTHVGMVIAPLGAGRVLTIEGNAAPGAASDAGAAQGVHIHVRENTPEMRIVGYGRPDWDTDVASGWAVPAR